MKIIDTECNSFLSNTSLLRGEQVFTSLLFYGGQFLYLEEHLERLIQGAKFFFPLRSWEKTKEEIRDYLYQKIETRDPQNYYCRLTIIDDSFFLIFKVHELSANSLSLTSGFQIKTPNLRPSYLKLGQYADSVLELKTAKNKNFDDVVFYDNSGFITETSTSNIFLVNPAGEVKTPYSSSMVLAGVLRSQIMKSLKAREANLTRSDLENAQEIWLSNSIKGIRFINRFDNKNFSIHESMYNKMIETFGQYGEKCE